MEFVIVFLLFAILLVLAFGFLGAGAASLTLIGGVAVFLFWCLGGFVQGLAKGLKAQPGDSHRCPKCGMVHPDYLIPCDFEPPVP